MQTRGGSPAGTVPNALRPEGVRVAVFAKAPVPGGVKTRLAASVGEERAASLHERLAIHAIGTAIASGVGPVELWCAPDTDHPFFSRCEREQGVELHAQVGANLGVRMENAFARAFAAHRALVLIGADCPALAPRHLAEAASAVAAGEAAVSPAEDGGYVLVALARPVPHLFEDIAWGGEGVMAATRERLAASGMPWRELETLWDVDRPEDLQRLERVGGLAAGIAW